MLCQQGNDLVISLSGSAVGIAAPKVKGVNGLTGLRIGA